MFAAMPSRPNRVFWIKLAAQAVFGLLVIVDSFFLITCYITVNFFGVLANPLFSWLRACAFVAWILYFPALLGALLTIGIGHERKKSQTLAAVLFVLQMLAGFALYFSQGRISSAGSPLLYGPNVRAPNGELATCVAAFVCLVPLAWISLIHVATAFRSANAGIASNKTNLKSVLLAGLAAFLLYTAAGEFKSVAGKQSVSTSAMAVSLMAHLAVFALGFLILQWITVIARWSSHPVVVQFILRAVSVALFLGFVIRKIIFALLAFNSYAGTLYAAVFSFAVVLFVSSLALKIKEHRSLSQDSRPFLNFLSSRSGRVVAIFGTSVLFYFLTIRLAPVDWERIISSLSALLMFLLFLWICQGFWGQDKIYKPAFLLVLSTLVVGALAGIRVLGQGNTLGHGIAGSLDQYADYDPSFFVVQLALKPAVQDEAYAGFYNFLNRHANIRAPIPVPEITLTDSLKAERGLKPNIFFLVIDALRRDYLSPHNPAVTFTPHLDSFAKDSIVFQNAYTPYAGTALAEPAIWAGYQQLQKLYPPPHPRISNLQRMLEVDGYHCYISYDEVLYDIVPKTSNVTVLSSRMTRWQQKEFNMVIHEFEDDLLQRKNRDQPIFLYTQPADVHTLSIALHGQEIAVTPHPGFNDKYASAVEQVDQTFGAFIEFLKKQGLYENSIIIVTADHGESLGEMGRLGHVSNVTPEVIRIPLLVHLPERLRASMVWDAARHATLHDLAPTLYYLLGHRPLKHGEMLGHALFAESREEQQGSLPDHFFLMSSYLPIFGLLSHDEKELFMVDASLRRQYYYNLAEDPQAFKNKVTVPIRDHFEPILRNDLEKIDKFYGITEKELER